MTTWTLTCYDGRTYPLPTPLAWRLEYGVGDPCDSFWVKTLWTEGEEAILADLTRLQVTQGGETLFLGVVDECETCWGPEGCTATFSGRGMQALLLDNQAEAADFGLATWEAILARYVSPYGIALDRGVSLPAAAGFSVASGSSCWKVVYDFARYHGGVTPRFTRAGKLALHPWEDGVPLVLDGGAPVTRVVRRDQRYGVLSQVTVKDVSGWTRQTVVNEAFQAKGGQCSRVLLLPRKTGYQARRYQAQFQLDRSAAQLRTAEVTVALPFAAYNVVSALYRSAMDQPRPAFLISMLRGFVLILPLAFLLAWRWGMTGVWLTFPAAECGTMLIALLTGRQKKRVGREKMGPRRTA